MDFDPLLESKLSEKKTITPENKDLEQLTTMQEMSHIKQISSLTRTKTVVAEHQALLNSSRFPFVANLFPPLPEETSKQSKFSPIGTRFKVCHIGARSLCLAFDWLITLYPYVYAATTAIPHGNTEYNRTSLH